MTFTVHEVYLTKVDPSTNTDKFYQLHLITQENAFGTETGWWVQRRWGRGANGRSQGQSKLESYPSFRTAEVAWNNLRASKQKEGYAQIERKNLAPNIANALAQGLGLQSAPIPVIAGPPEPAFAPPPDKMDVNLSAVTKFMTQYRDLVTKGSMEQAAITRPTVVEQMSKLRTAVLRLEGEMEVVDALFSQRVQ